MTAAELAAKDYVQEALDRDISPNAAILRLAFDAMQRELDDALGRIKELRSELDLCNCGACP